MSGISRDFAKIDAVSSYAKMMPERRRKPESAYRRPSYGDGSFEEVLQQSIAELRTEQKGKNHMSTRYEDMTPEEKKVFDEGYDDWQHETGQDEVTDDDVAAMYEDFMKDHPEDDSLMGLDTDAESVSKNPFLDKINEGMGQLSIGKQHVVQDVRQMIIQRMQDIQETHANDEADIAALESQQQFIEDYWQRNGLDALEEIPAYVVDETHFDGTPAEYGVMVSERCAEMNESYQAELEEFFEQIYEASDVTSKGENGFPLLIDSAMRKDLNEAFNNGYEKFEQTKFNSFLNDMRAKHGVVRTTVQPGAIDYSRDVTVSAEQAVKTIQSEKQTAPAQRGAVVTQQPFTGISQPVQPQYRGMDVYTNTATEDDDWSFDEKDDTSEGLGE